MSGFMWLIRFLVFTTIAVLNVGGAIKGIQQGHSPYDVAISIVIAALMIAFALDALHREAS